MRGGIIKRSFWITGGGLLRAKKGSHDFLKLPYDASPLSSSIPLFLVNSILCPARIFEGQIQIK